MYSFVYIPVNGGNIFCSFIIVDHSDGRMRWKKVLWDWGNREGRQRGHFKADKVFVEWNLLTK